jgi:quercetin dioxygenase-like cupin family protein
LIGRRGFTCACCAGAIAGWTRQLGITPTMAAPDGGPPVVPVEKTSFHMPIFTNEYVTLLHVMVPPGHTSGYHKHSVDTASVVIESANVRAQILGEAPAERPSGPLGFVSFNTYSKKPLTHIITNIDTHPLQVVLVELIYSEAGRFSGSSRADIKDYKMEIDDRVRGWRLVLDPGQYVPVITQQAPGVRIVVSGGILAESAPDQRDREINLQRGDFFWQDANVTRALRNIGDSRIELVELELK